jgi:hypothetical protein
MSGLRRHVLDCRVWEAPWEQVADDGERLLLSTSTSALSVLSLTTESVGVSLGVSAQTYSVSGGVRTDCQSVLHPIYKINFWGGFKIENLVIKNRKRGFSTNI